MKLYSISDLRLVLEMRDKQKLTWEKIVEETQWPASTVYYRYRIAKDLEKKFQEWNEKS